MVEHGALQVAGRTVAESFARRAALSYAEHEKDNQSAQQYENRAVTLRGSALALAQQVPEQAAQAAREAARKSSGSMMDEVHRLRVAAEKAKKALQEVLQSENAMTTSVQRLHQL